MALSAAAKFPCGHDRPVLSVSWGKAGLVAAAGGDNSVRVYAAASPDGSAGAGAAQQATGEDATSGWREVAAVEAAHDNDVNCVEWHPTERGTLASCSDDGTVKVWSVRERAPPSQP
jgi:WD40 repeat protein